MQKRSPGKYQRARNDSQDPAQRRKHKAKVSQQRLPAPGGAKSQRSSGNVGSGLLNPNLKQENVFVIEDGSLFDNTVNDPASIPDALVFLYKCLKTVPGFKDTKNWIEQPSLQQLSDYFNEELNKLSGKQQWMFTKDDTGKRHLFFQMEKPDESMCLPLEWIEKIVEVNQTLYDLTILSLQLVQKAWHLDTVLTNWNDLIIDDLLNYEENQIENIDEEHLARTQAEVPTYKKGGEAYRMRELIMFTKLKGNALEHLNRKLSTLKVKSKFEKEILSWLKGTAEVCKNARSIDDYYFETGREEDYGPAINANDMFGFAWSFCDIVCEWTDNYMSDISNEAGIVGPQIRTEFSPFRKPKQSAPEKSIDLLAAWMDKGRTIYFNRFHQEYRERHTKNSWLAEEEPEDAYDKPEFSQTL
jgi:hypothetical protein